MNLMNAKVSLVDRTDRLGAVTAVKTEKLCRQLCHCELVGAHRMKHEYNYDHAIIQVQLGINQYSGKV